MLGDEISTPEQEASLRHEMGLDQPVHIRYYRFISNALVLEFGQSFYHRRPVIDLITERLPATIELTIVAMFIAIFTAVPLGVIAAIKKNSFIDKFATVGALFGVSMPAFWLALLLQLMFFLWLDLLPLGGRLGQTISLLHPIETITGFYLIDAAITGNWVAWRDAAWHAILPTAVLATFPMSLVIRMIRASMLEVLSETYVTAARAAGLRESEILFKLTLKNAVVPTLTILGLIFAFSITGAVLIETIFKWPGLGSYMLEAVLNDDVPVLFAVTLVVTLIYIAVNLIVDLVQASLDPRIRIGHRDNT